jgi:hypothetical protein
MPSVRDCAERLREQAYKTLLPQIQELEQALQSVRGSLSSGVQQVEQRLEALRHIELPTSELVLDEVLGEVIRQKDLEEGELVRFTRGMRQRETQEEILTFLLDSAQKCASRIALFVVRGDRCVGWSSRGFSESAAREIGDCSFPISDCAQFQDAFQSEDPYAVSDLSDCDSLSPLKSDSQGPWQLFPLRTLKRPIAVLLAGNDRDAPVESDSISVFVDFAALQLENVALKILYELTAARPVAAAPPAPSDAESAPETSYYEEPPADEAQEDMPEAGDAMPDTEPETEAVQESEPVSESAAVEQGDESAIPVSEPEEAAFQPQEQPIEEDQPEIAARQEAPPEEGLEPEAPPEEEQEPEVPPEEEQELEAAPEEAREPEAAPEEDQEPEAAPEEAQPVPEEEKLHSDAKRFARLLVSEIKLYNEQHVAEGRENRDLYLRLKRDIDRSREMYEKRVSATVSNKIDYFHDEILRILGDNDPSTLGSDYPGPRVES